MVSLELLQTVVEKAQLQASVMPNLGILNPTFPPNSFELSKQYLKSISNIGTLTPYIPPNTVELSKAYAKNFAEWALNGSIKWQEKFSHGNKYLAWFYQYVFMNIILAKPSLSLDCTRERDDILNQAGVTIQNKVKLIAIQFALDHSLPNLFVIGGTICLHQIPYINPAVEVVGGFLLGRIAYGSLMGVFHATAFAYLERSLNNLVSKSDDTVPIDSLTVEDMEQKLLAMTF